MPVLYIITGSNGAGKSSVGPDYIPGHLRDSFSIATSFLWKKEVSFGEMVKSHKECKKLATEVVENIFDVLVVAALKTNNDFAYEGHFTNDATWGIPQNFKDSGYEIHLVFFGLTDTPCLKSAS